MEKKELKELASDFLKRNPRVDKVFFTTDGQPFIEIAYAQNHATAKDLEIETFRRDGKNEEPTSGKIKKEQSPEEVIKGLKAEAKANATKLATAEGKVTELEGKVKVAEDKVKEAEGKLKGFETKAATAETKQKAAEGKIAAAESKAKDAEARAKAAEAKVKTLEKSGQ